jgi:flagellin-like hook-associated protein FlgL
MAQEISLTSAMRANLLSLQSTVNLLNRTQERLSTGKKVNSALDNPTNFFAARAHQNRANDIASLKDGMGEAIQTVKTASSGIDSISTLIESARGIAQAALSTSDATQRTQYLTQYNAVIAQIDPPAIPVSRTNLHRKHLGEVRGWCELAEHRRFSATKPV